MSKKIIIFSNNYWNLANFRKNLIFKLVSKKYKVFLIAKNDKSISVFNSKDITCNQIILDRSNTNLFHNLKTLYQIFFIFLKVNPTTVISFTIKPNIYSGFLCRILNINHIATISGLGYSFLSNRYFLKNLIFFFYKISLKKSKVIFHNDSDKNFFKKKILIKNSNLFTTPGSGIDLEKFDPNKYSYTTKGNNVFVMISRLLIDKGVLEYCKAAELIKRQNPNVQFLLIGKIDSNNPSFINIDDLKYFINNKFIKFLDEKSDIIPYILSADCVVLPSYREGLSKVILEGCALQKPIIASDVPGCRELVFNNFNGFRCKVGDFQDLVIQIKKFMKLKKETKITMGRNSRKLVIEKFNENFVINKYLSIIS